MATQRIAKFILTLSLGCALVPVSVAQTDTAPSVGSLHKELDWFAQNRRDPHMAVATLPQEYQSGARLFTQKCSACHSLGRSLEKSNLSADEWGDIVYRMQDMASSHLHSSQSDAVIKFLFWNDQQQRKGGKQ